MRFSFTHPMSAGDHDPRLVGREGLTRLALAAEAAGFDAIGFTDHPMPGSRWLAAGGHDALAPFSALAFCAAATSRLRLMTNIAVLPYRNPFILAKAAATVDVLSDGRLILGAGTGYQKAEYRALGADFDDRNDRFDETLEAMIAAWTTDDLAFEGHRFAAVGNTARPRPVQQPHPPIWIGGNSARARARVVRYGQGWSPFPTSAAMAATARTAALETVDDLRPMLDDLRRRLEEAGRSDPVDVHFTCGAGGAPGDDRFNPEEHLAGLDRLAGAGVTWIGVTVPGDDLGRAVEALGRYGEEVIG